MNNPVDFEISFPIIDAIPIKNIKWKFKIRADSMSAWKPHDYLLLVLGFMALMVNVITIMAIKKMRTPLTPHIRLLMNLTMADFFIALAFLLDEFVKVSLKLFTQSQWDVLECLFLIVDALRQTAHIVMLFSLTVLALDLYVAIVHPLIYRVNTKYEDHIIYLLTVIWLVAAFLGFSQIYLPVIPLGRPDSMNMTYCVSHLSDNKIQSEYFTLSVFGISMIIMIFTYGVIFIQTQRFLRETSTKSYDTSTNLSSYTEGRQSIQRDERGCRFTSRERCRKLRRWFLSLCTISLHGTSARTSASYSSRAAPRESSEVSSHHFSSIPSNNSHRERDNMTNGCQPAVLTMNFSASVDMQKRRFHRKLRCLFTTLTILGVFLLCFLPLYIVQIYEHVQITSQTERVSDNYVSYLSCLVLVNSILDPLIYSLRLNDVRTGYGRLFSCFRCKKSLSNRQINYPLSRQKSFSCGHLNYINCQQKRHSPDIQRNHQLIESTHRLEQVVCKSPIRYGLPTALRPSERVSLSPTWYEPLPGDANIVNTRHHNILLNQFYPTPLTKSIPTRKRCDSAPECVIQSTLYGQRLFYPPSRPPPSSSQQQQLTDAKMCKAILGIGNATCCSLLHTSPEFTTPNIVPPGTSKSTSLGQPLLLKSLPRIVRHSCKWHPKSVRNPTK